MKKLLAFQLILIISLATACTAEPTPSPADNGNLSRKVDDLERQVTRLQDSLATAEAQASTPNPEIARPPESQPASTANNHSAQADNDQLLSQLTLLEQEIEQLRSSPERQPLTGNICHRSIPVQEEILDKLNTRLCRYVTGEELIRITELSINTKTLKPGDFDGLINLEELQIQVEENSPPADLLKDLQSLELLKLDINSSDPWNLGTLLTGKQDLNKLTIEGPPVTLGPEHLQGLDSLEELNIQSVSSLHPKAFADLKSLQTVNIWGGRITETDPPPQLPTNLLKNAPQVNRWGLGGFKMPNIIQFATFQQLCRVNPQFYWTNEDGANEHAQYQVNVERAAVISTDHQGACRVGIGEPGDHGVYDESQIRIIDARPEASP